MQTGLFGTHLNKLPVLSALIMGLSLRNSNEHTQTHTLHGKDSYSPAALIFFFFFSVTLEVLSVQTTKYFPANLRFW